MHTVTKRLDTIGGQAPRLEPILEQRIVDEAGRGTCAQQTNEAIPVLGSGQLLVIAADVQQTPTPDRRGDEEASIQDRLRLAIVGELDTVVEAADDSPVDDECGIG